MCLAKIPDRFLGQNSDNFLLMSLVRAVPMSGALKLDSNGLIYVFSILVTICLFKPGFCIKFGASKFIPGKIKRA